MTNLETLQRLEQEYKIAQAVDRSAMQHHIELVSRYYDEQDPSVSLVDLDTAADTADRTDRARRAAWVALDAHKADMLSETMADDCQCITGYELTACPVCVANAPALELVY